MEENTSCDLGMLYKNSKNQMTGQGVSDQTFFFKKQNKTKLNTITLTTVWWFVVLLVFF